MQAGFLAEIAAGRDTWLAFTVMFDQALGVRADDCEGDYIRARALSIIRKRSARLGAWHSIIWTMERDRHRGLHLHGLGHAASDTNCQMRELIREGFGSACDVSAGVKLTHVPFET
jgi:hypothetical protein